MDELNMISFSDLREFVNILNGKGLCNEPNPKFKNFIYYVSTPVELFLVDMENISMHARIPELLKSTCIFDLKLLMTMTGRYLPICDKDTKEIIFTEEEFLEYRKKMSGIKEYGTGDFIFSENLYFEGLDSYLALIDKNIEEVQKKRTPIIEEITKIFSIVSLTVSIGMNSGGDIELVETGSTVRATNVPSDMSKKGDFDFTVRINPEHWDLVKQTLEYKLEADGHITKAARDKVRLVDVKIPGLEEKVDLDFSINAQKKQYLSTEDAIATRLENMKMQDEQKYRLVLANIMYAKDYLKHKGSYKTARGTEDRLDGGMGGVGIENWVLQNGGSLIDATNDFLAHAIDGEERKRFIDFENSYGIMDFGCDHVSVSKGRFPHHEFIRRNMRPNGYETMVDALLELQSELGIKPEEIGKSK